MRAHFFLLVLLSFSIASAGCGGEGGTSDSGTPRMDAPALAEDAPVLGADSPASAEDAPSLAEDAPTLTEDAPGATVDAPIAVDAPLAAQDAPLAEDAPGSGVFCGGIGGIMCRGRGLYCNYADCSIPDASGTCEAVPTVCPDVVDPVCGCDGNDYGNACEAAMAGVSVRSRGMCPAPADCRTTGCERGLECCTGGRSAGRCYAPGCLACCM